MPPPGGALRFPRRDERLVNHFGAPQRKGIVEKIDVRRMGAIFISQSPSNPETVELSPGVRSNREHLPVLCSPGVVCGTRLKYSVDSALALFAK